jgi:hypothetical protein
MIYRNTSIVTVLAKIFRDLNLRSENWVDDAIEWIGEALQLIAAPQQYLKKSNELFVVGHAVQFPIDLVILQGIYFNKASADLDYAQLPKVFSVRGSGSLTHSGMHANIHREGFFPDSPDETFQVSDGFIYTSFREGKIAITYYAFPCDPDGFPFVPDNQSFREALMWFVVMKLMLSGWAHSNPEITYGFAEARWLKYCTQARNRAQMPDLQRMEQFLKTWVVTASTDRYLNNFENRLSNVEITEALEYRSSGSSVNATDININLLQ